MTKNNFELGFEFFPPRTEKGRENLQGVYQTLSACSPDYVSVTYGALGSAQDGTLQTLEALQQVGAKTAPHLTCVGSTKAQIRDTVNAYLARGVDRIVVLRGDLPEDMNDRGEFNYAEQLIRFLREEFGNDLYLEVAAYPEFHPESSNVTTEIQYFKRKIDAGANAAITQYFYNANAYFAFLDDAQRVGIRAPIIPGIMPIVSYEQTLKFSNACGAEVPRWILSRLEHYQHDQASFTSFANDVVTHLCYDLLDHQVPGLHFYALNKADPVMDVCKLLGFVNGKAA